LSFYVYTHRRADTGAVFYVGKGRNRRAWNRSTRNAYWKKIAAKTDVIVEIVKDGLSELCAFSMEKALIYCLKAKGLVLANLSFGGEGPTGRVFSEETREKMRLAKLGTKQSDEHRAAIAKAHKGKVFSEAHKMSLSKRVFTESHREALRISALGRKHSAETIQKISELKRKAHLAKEGA